MGNLDYANARVAARRATLLGPRGLRELAAQPTRAAQLELLRRGAWAAAAQRVPADAPLEAAERALVEEVGAQQREIEAFLDDDAAALLRACLLLDAAAGLKVLLRGVARGEPADVVADRVVPLPELPEGAIRAVAAAGNLEAAASALERAGSFLAPALRAALPAARLEPALLHLEVALDRAVLSGARGLARGRGDDPAVARAALALHADHVNAATLLALDSAARAAELHLPGRRVRREDFARIAALSPPERPARLAPLLGPGPRGAGLDPADLETPGRAEGRLATLRERALHAEARARPLSLAVPLHWLQALRAELRRVRLVLRGTAFGIPPDELLDLVEA